MAFDTFQFPDGAWRDSASMERSSSQSTNSTVDSTFTAGSFSSGFYSHGHSSSGATYVEDEDFGEPAAAQYYHTYTELPGADHLLSATGSQYQHTEQRLPQTLHLPSLLQLFDSRIASIEEAAIQATDYASFLIFNQQAFDGGAPSVISSEAVEEALQSGEGHGQEAARAAVQDVLYQQLYRQLNDMDHFYIDTTRIIAEAAYQLQLRLRGPEVYDICYFAITAALAKLREDLETNYSGAVSSGPVSSGPVAQQNTNPPPTPTQPPAGKEKFPCLIQGCEQRAFSRSADLDRHYKMKHVEDEQKKRYRCDYKRCSRHNDPFYRMDHFRDHLRVYHKEDLLRRGNHGNKAWWEERSPKAVFDGWWRCNRCLAVRVDYSKHGFVCPGCGGACEAERQKYRMAVAA